MTDTEREPPMTRTCLMVLTVEALVLLVLWAVGRYFGND